MTALMEVGAYDFSDCFPCPYHWFIEQFSSARLQVCSTKPVVSCASCHDSGTIITYFDTCIRYQSITAGAQLRLPIALPKPVAQTKVLNFS